MKNLTIGRLPNNYSVNIQLLYNIPVFGYVFIILFLCVSSRYNTIIFLPAYSRKLTTTYCHTSKSHNITTIIIGKFQTEFFFCLNHFIFVSTFSVYNSILNNVFVCVTELRQMITSFSNKEDFSYLGKILPILTAINIFQMDFLLWKYLPFSRFSFFAYARRLLFRFLPHLLQRINTVIDRQALQPNSAF